MKLRAKDRSRLENLSKGFEGELKFYYLLKEYLSSNSINLFDLRLERNGSEFQIDSLLLFQQKSYLIEVKNFDGDFVQNDDQWYSVNLKRDIQNPLQQMQRCELLLKDTFHHLGIQLPIESFLIFINPEFILYNSPRKQPIVFAGQLHRFITMLNNTPSTMTRHHREIKEELVRRHIDTSSRERLPEYNYEQLRKGIMCGNCGGVMRAMNLVAMKCESCKKEESKDSAILRSVYEFHVLFPNRKITLNSIYEWCGEGLSKKIIRRVLAENMERKGGSRSTYYMFKEQHITTFILKQNRMRSNNKRPLLRFSYEMGAV